MILDPFSKTVSIPIKIVNGYPCLFPEGKLPALKDGTIGDLIVPEHALENEQDATRFNNETRESFLATGTKLVVDINPEAVPKDLKDTVMTGLPLYCGAGVEVVLSEEMKILMRGTKSAQLMSCKCTIPSLKLDATSINHAYTIASQAYEPNRQGHTGNVFAKVFFSKDGRLLPLKELRGY